MRSGQGEEFATWLRFAAGLGVLGVVVYGRNLGDGFLSDDYIYLERSRHGLASLLRAVTVDSYPQMIRPLAVLPWMLSGFQGANVLLHAISLLIHVVNASLIAFLVWRRSGSRPASFLAGALFLVVPLFGEPVLWLSCGFDLWAALFALLALIAVQGGTPARLSSVGLYALALLSKESVFALPLLVPWVVPRATRRWTMGALAVVGGAYLSLRWGLFRGIGGYGSATISPATPVSVAQALFTNLPFAMLVPFKQAYGLQWLVASVSVLILAGLLVACRRELRPLALLGSLLAGLLAILPTLPVVGLAVDFAGGRFFYFPIAMTVLSLGLALGALPGRALAWATVLAVYWAAASHWNARSWSEASHAAEATLAGMQALQGRFPARSLVLVDTADMHDGAYIFRVGLAEAARWRGLRANLRWQRGTIGSLDAAGLAALGERVFLVGLDDSGRPVDWTACGRELIHTRRMANGQGAASATPAPLTFVGRRRLLGRLDAQGAYAVAVALSPAACRFPEATHGLFYWRSGNGRFFTMSDSQPLLLAPPGCESIVRLPARARLKGLEVRIDLAQALPADVSAGDATLMAVAIPALGACPR